MQRQRCLVSFVADNSRIHGREVRSRGIIPISFDEGEDPEVSARIQISRAFNCPPDDVTMVIVGETFDDE